MHVFTVTLKHVHKCCLQIKIMVWRDNVCTDHVRNIIETTFLRLPHWNRKSIYLQLPKQILNIFMKNSTSPEVLARYKLATTNRTDRYQLSFFFYNSKYITYFSSLLLWKKDSVGLFLIHWTMQNLLDQFNWHFAQCWLIYPEVK